MFVSFLGEAPKSIGVHIFTKDSEDYDEMWLVEEINGEDVVFTGFQEK